MPIQSPLINQQNYYMRNQSTKMALEVELISTQTIKPSSPTPPHLKTLKLCLLDQLMPLIPIPILLFYTPSPHGNTSDDILNRLKKSLSDVLTDFYPLAGRISDNLTIQCNDEGVNFFQTRVTGQLLHQVVTNPISDELIHLLPKDNFKGEEPNVLLSIQANVFDCGGIVICVGMSHKAGDASSLSLFLDTWARVARGENPGSPKFDMTSFFPPKDLPSNAAPLTFSAENIVSKRFVFTASNIVALRAKCSDKRYLENPSRVEVVSALMWRCAMNIKSPTSAAAFAINARTRMDPPLSNAYFGNVATCAMVATTPETGMELPYLVGQMRDAVGKTDGPYLKKLQGDGIFEILGPFAKANELCVRGAMELYNFTSWCRLPFYEADFGWGKPVWLCTANIPGKNIIALLDTKSGNGVEAWITLNEADMAKFECEPELLAFTVDDQTV